MYSEQLLQLFHHPTGRREVDGSQRKTRRENPVCGDVLELEARLEGGKIAELGFSGRGCPPVVAAAEWLCRWVPGRDFREVRQLNEETLEQALGGVPRNKRHALSLCLEALDDICRDL